MDILIKNMEMPINCNRCKLATHYFTNTHKVRCFINAEMREADGIDSRPKWCPLVALPEHGRLISDTDVKALLRSGLSLDSDSDIDYVCGLIDGLQTIVEATE